MALAPIACARGTPDDHISAMNITAPIRMHAAKNPDRIAVVRMNGTAVTYREFDLAIDTVAGRIAGLGLAAGDTVGVPIVAPYRFLTVAFALARSGIAFAPLSLAAERMDAYIARRPVESPTTARFVAIDQVCVENESSPGEGSARPLRDEPGAVVAYFASSGTTGTIKHVAITHDMIGRRVHSRGLMVPLPDQPVQIALIGLCTHFGFKSIVRVLWAGGQVVLPGKMDEIHSLIARHQVNCLVLAPVTLSQLLESLPQGSVPPPSLECIEFGGSMMPRGVYELARARLCQNIVSLYGTTESGAIAAAPMSRLIGRPGAVGYVHRGVEVEAVGADDTPLPAGTEGALRVRSATCVDRYVEAGASTAIAFKDGWFYPGDVGTVSKDGLLTLAGRTREIINRGGVKVGPRVVEDVLLSLPEIREAAVFGAPDASGITQIWAAIVPAGPVDMAALRKVCSERLLDKTPRFIVKVKKLPRNEAGKILRERLVTMAASILSRQATRQAARAN